MAKRAHIVLVILVLLIAAALRVTHLDWDEYNHYHPDERYITWVATSIEWPVEWNNAFVPDKSTFNPFYWPASASSDGVVLNQDEPRRFAYGHLPLYLGVGLTRAMESISPKFSQLLPDDWLITKDIFNLARHNEFRHLTAVGRALTAVVDVATVGLLYFLGRWVFSKWVGLLAAAFLALNVMHIQLAHFFTADPYLTFFTLGALVFMVAAFRSNVNSHMRTVSIIFAAFMVGLAVGSKFGGVLLFLPLTLTIFMQHQWSLGRRLIMMVMAGLIASLTFFVTNPFAFLDSSCVTNNIVTIGGIHLPERILRSCYLQNVFLQGTMVRGLRDVPFVRQYIGTLPYIYFIEMQLRWGMGLLLGLAGFIGLVWATWRVTSVVYDRWHRRLSNRPVVVNRENLAGTNMRFPVTSPEFVLLSWCLPFFVTTGVLNVKFMRYLQPLVPFLMLYGAAMLLSIRSIKLRRAIMALVLLVTGVYALAFVNLYQQPHPWIAASGWIYKNIPPGESIVSEMWDDRLPDNIMSTGVKLRNDIYDLKDVNWLSNTADEDDLNKLKKNLTMLADADYIVLASNRNYGVIPRLQEMYPLSSQYYPLLFDGSLGFEVVYVGTRTPNLFGFHLKPEPFDWPGLTPPDKVAEYLNSLAGVFLGRFDESFTVYDQPLVIILENSGRLSADEMINFFKGI